MQGINSEKYTQVRQSRKQLQDKQSWKTDQLEYTERNVLKTKVAQDKRQGEEKLKYDP